MTAGIPELERPTELEALRARLAESEEALRAIHAGDVDAVVVTGRRGEQVYTRGGAYRVYRQLFETMSEGALTLSADGVILYCNTRVGEMLGRPIDEVMGSLLRDHLPPADQQVLAAMLSQARTESSRREIRLKTAPGELVPAYLSASRLEGEGATLVFGLVLTDLTEQKTHERVAAAERLARLILEQAAGPIVVCDEAGMVIRASQTALQFCDESPLLRNFAEVFPLRTGGSGPFDLASVLQGATLRDVDVSLDRQGRRLDLILNAGPLLGGLRILGCVVTLTDITGRKQAANELLEKGKLLAEAQRLGLFGSWFLDGTGRLSWSEELYRIFGVSPATFTPTLESVIDLIDPDDRPAVQAWIAACAAGDCPGELEYRIRLPDGAVRFISARGEAVHDAGTGTTQMAGTAQDVTARKLGESSLRLQSAALNAAANAIYITDCDGVIEWVNSAFTAYTGYGAAEAVGCASSLTRSGKQGPEFYRTMWGTILAGEVWRGEMIDQRKDGSHYHVEMTITPLKEASGRISHFIAVQHDISQRMALEGQVRQSQKMEAVGRLAGGVAHDFNNMLSVILGYGQLVLDKLREGDPLRGQVMEIMNAGRRSASLTSQLLAFSRKQILQPAVVDLNPLLEDLHKMLGRLIGEDVDLVLTLSPDIGRVIVDRGQMEQILMNLAVNARDAMPGGGRLSIETANAELDGPYAASHPGASAGRYVMVSVTDTGCGMDAETMSKIFEPFFTTKESGKGTGLGLAMVYGIVKQSAGHVSVRSEVGVGTTFEVYLPRSDAAASVSAAAPAEAVRRGEGQRILVVEDETAVRRLVEAVLTGLGYRVTIAANSGEALLLVEEKGFLPDLLVTDLVMPGLGGEVLVTRLRRKHPGLRVLLMSGYTGTQIGQQGGLSPGTPFIHKPFTVMEIASKVEQVLKGAGVVEPRPFAA